MSREARRRAIAEIVGALAARSPGSVARKPDPASTAEAAEQIRRQAMMERWRAKWLARCRDIAGRGPGRTILLSLALLVGWVAAALALLDGPERIFWLVEQVRIGELGVTALTRPLLAPSLLALTLLVALWAGYLTAGHVVRRGALGVGLFERVLGQSMRGLIVAGVAGAILWLVWLLIAGALSGQFVCLFIVAWLATHLLARVLRRPAPTAEA